mmetsp:Transcript_189/g.336  ORF Transcript_189/g.336 Transcript_189/m.336 type:complete len:301 (-) Transcript_189:1429-2331(-)
MFGYNYNRDVVLVSLKRSLRVETAATVPRTPSRDETPKSKPWFSSVWEDIKAGTERMTKSMEKGFVSTGDKIEEAGAAAGQAASDGWESTSKAASEAKKTIKEAEAAAEDALQGAAGAKSADASQVDAATLERLRQLEEENRILRERLEKQLLDESSGAAAGPTRVGEGSHREQTLLPTSNVSGTGAVPNVQSSNGNGSATVVQAGAEARKCEVPSPQSMGASQCTIRVRMTDGALVEKKFSSTTTVRQVIESALPDPADRMDYTLMLPFPRRIFLEADMDRTLQEASLVPAATLNVTRR